MPSLDLESQINLELKLCLQPVRQAKGDDLHGIVELWANSACLKQMKDSVRWDWKDRVTDVWFEYARELLDNPWSFLIICDFKDNGLSGFLTARLEKLPSYYKAEYVLRVDEFYIRPKERSSELLEEMLKCLLREVNTRFVSLQDTKISLRMDVFDGDQELVEKLFNSKVKKSSANYTINF